MEIKTSEKNGVSIVTLCGHLTGPGVGSLLRSVNELMERPGAKVVIDLHGVEFIGSAGLGDLVRITAQANTQGGRLVLAAPSPFVLGVLETTRLDKFFEICADVDSAIGKMGKP